ncbi:hypothetical protein CSB37_02750 [bacterium DOLZORAL124_38_8]|nr:MAG: hypothetical protein CSB37_02750 [bacterium DOLZORAL124_38_8]
MIQTLYYRFLAWKKKLRPVGAIILEREGKYLLVEKPRTENAWQFPQGGVEMGETFYQGALRELREECGASIEVESDQKLVARYQYLFPKQFRRPDHRYKGANVEFFAAKYVSGEIELDENELKSYCWATPAEIKQKVTAAYWRVVKKILENK